MLFMNVLLIVSTLLLHETIEIHRAITEAISKHDYTGARCAMDMHLIYNRQMIMKLIVSAVFMFSNVTHRLLLHETIETHRAITTQSQGMTTQVLDALWICT